MNVKIWLKQQSNFSIPIAMIIKNLEEILEIYKSYDHY